VIFVEQISIVAIIFTFFTAFLFAYRIDFITNPKKIMLIGIIFILQAAFASVFVNRFNLSEYFIPITLAAMSLTIMFDSRTAFIGTITISLLVGAQIGGNLSFVFTSIFASTFAIYSVRKLRKRSQVFQSIIFII
jgi:membrane-associated HD superfamily phosphohydrolase